MSESHSHAASNRPDLAAKQVCANNATKLICKFRRERDRTQVWINILSALSTSSHQLFHTILNWLIKFTIESQTWSLRRQEYFKMLMYFTKSWEELVHWYIVVSVTVVSCPLNTFKNWCFVDSSIHFPCHGEQKQNILSGVFQPPWPLLG